MNVSRLALGLTVIVLAAVLVAGCGRQNGEQPGAQSPATTGTDAMPRDPGIEKALAQLSPEDRALAEQQEVCPVTGKPLGSMGKPIKVALAEQDVFVCCPGCVETVKENPEKYLAKLRKE